MKKSPCVIFSSEFVKKDYIKSFNLDSSKAIVRPQGLYYKNIFKDNLEEARRSLRDKLNLNYDCKIVLACGYGDYRKGMDLFFDTAKKVKALNLNDKIKFVWLGDRDSDLEKKLLEDAKSEGYSDFVKLNEFEKEPAVFFAGADVFILTSREDPFPSVVLESMDCGVPVIAFDNAGGIPEILSNGNGVLVSYESTEDMANEIGKLVSDTKYYEKISNKAISIIDKEYKFYDYVSFVVGQVSTDSEEGKLIGDKKKEVRVSVVVPNYNYEKFLEERLSSVVNQTIPPHEIIFLDDNSSDQSVSIAEQILSNTNIPYRIITNEVNCGCFRQWVKGIKNATGDIIWIAEADDVCKVDFLENLLPLFDDKNVNLAYCQSEIIDFDGNKVKDSYHFYTDNISEEKWRRDYIVSGDREMNDGLAIKNTIPNASAVLMRKEALKGVDKVLARFKSAGDWRSYAYVLRSGKIAYVKKVLNSHRRHPASIIGRVEKSKDFFKELFAIQKGIIEDFTLSKKTFYSMQENIVKEYKTSFPINKQLCFSDDDELKCDYLENKDIFVKKNNSNRKLNYIIVLPDMNFGGGQVIAIEQANALAVENNVFLYNARPELKDDLLMARISDSVNVIDSTGADSDFFNACKVNEIDIVFSHIWWSDKLVWKSLQLGEVDFKWIIVMHGCYEMLIDNLSCDSEFNNIVTNLLERADQIMYTADKNKKIIEIKKPEIRRKLIKINNGITPGPVFPAKALSRSDFGIEKNAFIFGLCARAISEKGWEEAIEAVKIIESDIDIDIPVHLFLIGDGEYSRKLKMKHHKNKHLHFMGNRNDLHLFISLFDSLVLPTYFKSESQPMIIIESFAQKRPVIATEIGEISYMINNEGRRGGLLVPLIDNKPDMDMLVSSMKNFILDRDGVYTKAKNDSGYIFGNYDMKNIVKRYIEIAELTFKS